MQTAAPSTDMPRRETLNIRDAARRAAEEALLDQAILQVSPEIYAEFAARLEAPPSPNNQLRKTMQCSQPWDPA